MKKLFLILAFVVASLSVTAPPAKAQFDGCLPGLCSPPSAATCTEAGTFLARTSGLDATHTTAYTNLICGLVTDGVWAKLDLLYIYATQDSTTALLNLISTNFTSTAHGSPTFTVDRGFTGVEGNNSVYIDTGFNPTTAVSPNYVTNSAHLSVWNLTDISSAHEGDFGADVALGSTFAHVTSKFSADDTVRGQVNNNGTDDPGPVVADARGYVLATRSAALVQELYKNASLLATGIKTSTSPPNLNFTSLGGNQSGFRGAMGKQQAMVSAGSKLSLTEVTNFYGRSRTYMTAVGVP